MQFSQFSEFSAKHPKSNKCDISYGTAGFRYNSDELDSIVFRIGALASLRSSFKCGKAVGIMVTASHNPEEDNGVKIIDPNGEMLETSWESIATNLANSDDNNVQQVLSSIIEEMKIDETSKGLVFVARDTRKSSPQLSAAAIDGVKAVAGDFIDFGLLTTPQLHFIVHCYNYYGEPTEEGYYKKLSKAFIATNVAPNEDGELVIDCANGVGAEKFKKLMEFIGSNGLLKAHLCNTGEGILNYKCGADFVKQYQRAPEGILLKSGVRYVSFDGDADRIVYFYERCVLEPPNFCLIDGDKIAVLFTLHLKELLQKLRITSQIKFCVVQTAYANGNSTSYIRDVLGVETACVPTGVKHLHHRAQQADVGVYFEANGHGTVIFSEKVLRLIKNLPDTNTDKHYILNFIDLINQTNGDAISDLLVVETILNYRNLSVHEWNSLYTDLPNRQLKVKVADRSIIQTTFDETKCVAPIGLQEAIDAVVSRYGYKARAFVRPSGTEDIVRVYAETDSYVKTDQLANEIAAVVNKLLQ